MGLITFAITYFPKKTIQLGSKVAIKATKYVGKKIAEQSLVKIAEKIDKNESE